MVKRVTVEDSDDALHSAQRLVVLLQGDDNELPLKVIRAHANAISKWVSDTLKATCEE